MFNNSGYSLADIAAATGGNRNNDGFMGDGWWIILLFLFGWGNNGNGGFFGNGGSSTREEIAYGFDMNGLENGVRGIQQGLCDGFYAMNTGMLNGFSNVQSTLCQGFSGVNQSITNATIADMQNTNTLENAVQGIGTQLASCCCDIRSDISKGLCDLGYALATQECQTRQAIADSTRDIIDSQNKNSQMILDKLCALELDGYKRENDNLRTQLNMANLQASQTAQTAELSNSQATTANQLVNELRSCPIPAQPVYGNTPIFTCAQNVSGCGCNGFNG